MLLILSMEKTTVSSVTPKSINEEIHYEKPTLEELADSLANLRRGVEAAEVYAAAAARAEPGRANALRQRAAEELLIAGHLDRGLLEFRELLTDLGLGLPRGPRRALFSLLWRRLWLGVRGVRFRERPIDSVPVAALARADACWKLSLALAGTDLVVGASFVARSLQLALRCGDPHRVARSLASEAGLLHASSRRGSRRGMNYLARADMLARGCEDPHALAYVYTVRALVAYLDGQFRQGLAWGRRAEAGLTEQCVGATWELANTRLTISACLLQLGDLKALGRLRDELEPEFFTDPEILALTAKVSFADYPDSPFPKAYSGAVVIRLKDGREVSHHEPVNRGAADRPIPNGEIVAKFRDNAALWAGPARVAAMEASLLALDGTPRAADALAPFCGV